MIKKLFFGMLAAMLSFAILSTAVFADPGVIVTNSGLALLSGETSVRPGSPVVIQIVKKEESILAGSGFINGYVNETLVQPDGTYKLLFSLDGIYESGKEYDCHIDLAGEEYFVVPLAEGSLIDVTKKAFDRDSKTVSISGRLWDKSSYGINLTLKIGTYEKTVQSSDDGKFLFEFTMSDAGIDYGICNFVIEYTDDSSNYCEGSVELLSAEPVLKSIRDNLKNSAELEKILTDTDNLTVLGFDSDVLFGDCELSDLKGSEFFEKLASTDVKADTVSNLTKSIKTAYSLYNMEKNPSDKNLKRNIDFFETEENEITDLYENFNKTESDYLFTLWGKTSFTNIADAQKYYKEAVLLTKLNTAEAWSNLMLFVNENSDILDVEQQKSADFWQNLISYSPFSSTSDFQTKYKEVLKKKNNKTNGGGGTGGSGGSGGSGKGFHVATEATAPAPTTENNNTGTGNNSYFKDISEDFWGAAYINKLYEIGIVNGKADGIFAPNDTVTRAEVAKLMCVSAKLDEMKSGEQHFSDVNYNHWAFGYIEAVFENGLVNGRGEGIYAPDDYTTREDMAVFCYRLLKIIKPEYTEMKFSRDDLSYDDSDSISDYAVNAVAAMTKLGIIQGKGENVFDPKAYCKRAEAAKIFCGILL